MTVRDPSPADTAVATALRMLARRPLTQAEMRKRLEAGGHAGETIDEVCERMRSAGYLDDSRLSLDFIVARAARLGHGPRRLFEDLRRRGVAREVAEAAWRLAVQRHDVEPLEVLRRQLRRHLRGEVLQPTGREYARVYNALRRAGFDEDAIRQELDSLGGPVSRSEPTTDGTSDDIS